MNLEQARTKLGVRCLSVMQHESHCTVYLHFGDDECCSGFGEDFKAALKAAIRERREQSVDEEEWVWTHN